MMDLVEVVWVDIHSWGNWRTQEEVRELASGGGLLCRSVGYLVGADVDGATVLVQSINSFGHLAEALVIPRGATRSVRVLLSRTEPFAGMTDPLLTDWRFNGRQEKA